MQTPSPYSLPDTDALSPAHEPPAPGLAPASEPDFGERHDDPEQAEELERQQDA